MTASPRALPSDGDRTGRDLGDEEIALVAEALRSGTLNATRGTFVRRFERAFAAAFGAPEAVAAASGTAAVHAALAALALQSGDEVITTAITDMGAITPILYEGAVPVFADVDAATGNVTAATIAARLTSRTRAVIVTHLFGMPCDMRPILELVRDRGVVLIEDCAQAPLAEDVAGTVGTLGALACFSFQQSKHLTTGEGGMVLANDAALGDRVRRFVNKGWGYGDAEPDHDFPALNGRLTELQGAVGLAQLGKLPSVLARRRATADRLRAELDGVPGVAMPPQRQGVVSSWWRVCLDVDPDVVEGGPDALAPALAALGLAARPRYIGVPAYRTRLFREWRNSPVTRVPFEQAGRTPEPPAGSMAGTERALRRMLVLPWNELFTDDHVAAIASTLRAAVSQHAGHG